MSRALLPHLNDALLRQDLDLDDKELRLNCPQSHSPPQLLLARRCLAGRGKYGQKFSQRHTEKGSFYCLGQFHVENISQLLFKWLTGLAQWLELYRIWGFPYWASYWGTDELWKEWISEHETGLRHMGVMGLLSVWCMGRWLSLLIPHTHTHTHTHTTHTHLIENSAEPKELKSEFLKQNNMNKTAKIVHLLRTLTSMYLNISW